MVKFPIFSECGGIGEFRSPDYECIETRRYVGFVQCSGRLVRKFDYGSRSTGYNSGIGNKEVTLKVFYIRDMGSYAVWRATKVTGQYDAKTFQVKARPVEPVDNLRPGMSVLLKRDKK